MPLHSILVKSIHEAEVKNGAFSSLYIPFWLNLYALLTLSLSGFSPLHSILVKSIQKYAIFLSPSIISLHSILVKSILDEFIYLWITINTLHSILVKSILSTSIDIFVYLFLYIPFWLNLYTSNHRVRLWRFALHSILVKSIL